MKLTILVIGGFNKTGYEEVGKKKGNYNVLFHDGIKKDKVHQCLRRWLNKLTVLCYYKLLVPIKRCGKVKKLSKKYAVPATYPKSRGVSGAINSAIEVFQNKVSFFAS